MDRIHLPDSEESKRFYEYLRYNSYRSERYKLFYVATPKVACTSLKWWFARLEGYDRDIRECTDSAETDPDLVIHDTFHRIAPHVTGLMPDDLAEALASDSYFRFAVVSNPFRRIFSAWQSKLLLREPLQVGPYRTCDFLHHPIECKEDIADAFEEFLGHLVSNESPDFWDFHWTPQATLLRPDLISYTKLVKIERVKELNKALAGWLGSKFSDPFTAPRLNESLIPYCQEFLTGRSIGLIRSLYGKDFELFRYDTQVPQTNQPFTDDQFDLARKAVRLIRGRHQRLDEQSGRIVRISQQLTQQELIFRESENTLNQRNEELVVTTTGLNQIKSKLQQKTKALRQKTGELHLEKTKLAQKISELKQKTEEVNQQQAELAKKTSELNQKNIELEQRAGEVNRCKAEIRRKTVELGKKTLELEQKTEELGQKEEEIARQKTELRRKASELRRKTSELRRKSSELGLVASELQERTDELNQRTSELHGKSDEADQKTEELNQQKAELSRKIAELSRKTEQLNQILRSKTWILTKPVRMLLDLPGKGIGEVRQFILAVASIARQHGGILNAARKTIQVLSKEGFGRISFHYRMQASRAGKDDRPTGCTSDPGSSGPCEPLPGLATTGINTHEQPFQGSSSVLFIGHDARLAGAQVLLLGLIRWLREHSGIRINIILLEGGVLLEKFKEIAPTAIWEEIIREHPGKEDRQKWLAGFAGKIHLVYGNTVLSPAIYDELEFLHAPFITHVHELEQSIKLYAGKPAIEKMKEFTNGYIACSNPVGRNLSINHAIEKEKIVIIHEFTEDRQGNCTIPRIELQKKLGLTGDGIIVMCCGTLYWRKGGDLFVETALRLKQKGFRKFHFYWIGENIWDQDIASFPLSSWSKLEQKITDNGLDSNITFLGVKENVFDYLLACDVFYLPSREDPFPLVCLEAAQCGIPVICFEGAGGMPGFVENDAGFIVPFEDVDAAADKILFLYKNPSVAKRLGETARSKVSQRHTLEKGATEILHFCRKAGNLRPAVSIIVPNYNCEKFLKKRLESIWNQTFRDFELIILDDASTDRSLEIIGEYLHLPGVRLIRNKRNSGNPFIQWQKGLAEAKGEIIWFAEADDVCEPDFLQQLLPSFNDASVALTYCDSFIIDEHDTITGDYSQYYRDLDPVHWNSSYQVTGTREINFGLGVKNSIPNASAALIRKSCIPESFLADQGPFRFSGDWFFYTRVIKGRSVAFHSGKLNYHRKHRQTITSEFNTGTGDLLLHEAELIHRHILESFSIDAGFLDKWESYMTRQILAFYPAAEREGFDKHYPFTRIEEKIKDAIQKSDSGRRLVFITTNDGSVNGGSEQLWRRASLGYSRRGHEVMVVIKKWDPEPFFLNDFHTAGIPVIFKEPGHFDHIRKFNPDLLIMSLGDQDEGIDYYKQCETYGIPYVIVNQLTKEPKYWPVDSRIHEQVKQGYLGAGIVLFTGRNNQEVMEKRLRCKIPQTGIFFNPYDVDLDADVPFPSTEKGLHIAIVGNLLRIHKGQHLALELFHRKKWRNRPLHLNIYGEGIDEAVLKKQAADYHLKNVTFHGYTYDIPGVWKMNHAILMPSFMEGLPLALVGAMICGRVPVVTDIGAHGEVIEDNISGFIASEPTVDALDEALERAFQR